MCYNPVQNTVQKRNSPEATNFTHKCDAADSIRRDANGSSFEVQCLTSGLMGVDLCPDLSTTPHIHAMPPSKPNTDFADNALHVPNEAAKLQQSVHQTENFSFPSSTLLLMPQCYVTSYVAFVHDGLQVSASKFSLFQYTDWCGRSSTWILQRSYSTQQSKRIDASRQSYVSFRPWQPTCCMWQTWMN